MLLLCLCGILIINRLPIIGQILKVVSTMFHEMGHALMAILTQGKVFGIILIREKEKNYSRPKESWKKRLKNYFFNHPFFDNREGVAVTGSKNWASRLLVALAGYPSEMGAAILLLYLYVNDKHALMLYFLIGVSVITLFFIRNKYGYIWLFIFGSTLYFALRYQEQSWVHYYLLTVTLICIVESVYSSFTILVLSFTDRKNAGDSTILAKQTFIPAVIWGLLFFIFNLYILYLSRDLFIMLKTAISSLWEWLFLFRHFLKLVKNKGLFVFISCS